MYSGLGILDNTHMWHGTFLWGYLQDFNNIVEFSLLYLLYLFLASSPASCACFWSEGTDNKRSHASYWDLSVCLWGPWCHVTEWAPGHVQQIFRCLYLWGREHCSTSAGCRVSLHRQCFQNASILVESSLKATFYWPWPRLWTESPVKNVADNIFSGFVTGTASFEYIRLANRSVSNKTVMFLTELLRLELLRFWSS